MNRIMIELIPELDSEWATAPMAFGRWRRPDETIDNGDPCYIASAKDTGFRQNYIYMKRRKDLPAGYYHLRTQEAYVEVYWRLCHCKKAPPMFPFMRRRKHSSSIVCTRNEFKQVKTIIYNRVVCKEPNDIWAARMALLSTASAGGQAAGFGKALYLPTLTTTILLSLAGGA